MSLYEWTNQQKVTVPASDSIAIAIPAALFARKNLTIWAVSGVRSVRDLSFQPRVNQDNYGSAVAHVGPARLGKLIWSLDGIVLPPYTPPAGGDALSADINITSTHVAAQFITLYITAVGYHGG